MTTTLLQKEYMMQNRLNWLDSMKALGVFIIVSGHYFPPNHELLYVFSVQLFFIMSGFLSKKESHQIFIRKTFSQLIIPMILLGIIYHMIIAMIDILSGSFSIGLLIQKIYGLFIGNTRALAGLWFVYTLVLSKIISQFTPKSIKPIVAILCLAGSLYLNEYTEMAYRNCFVNTLLAYPVFFIGETLSRYKKQIDGINNRYILGSFIIIGATGVLISKLSNNVVWMYLGEYGSNIGIFLIGGMCGTMMCFGLCKLFFNRFNHYILLLAEGSILVLAFQNFFIRVTSPLTHGYGYYLTALLSLIAFIPLIIICKRYFPILVGYRGRSFKNIKSQDIEVSVNNN